jgi:hypothetical protein
MTRLTEFLWFPNVILIQEGESGNLDLPFFIDFYLTPDSSIRYGAYVQNLSLIIQ